jgi:hypothetical protein
MANETMIAVVRLLHTAIFLFVSGCILYVLVCAIIGRTSAKLINAAAIIATVVGISWLLNGHECPLASVVYRLSGGDHSVADIYFPGWFSRWIMTGSTLVMIVAGFLVLWRTLTHRWQQ